MAMPLVDPGVIANVILYASEAEKISKGTGFELIPVTAFVSFLVFIVLALGIAMLETIRTFYDKIQK